MKECKTCKEKKPITEFDKVKNWITLHCKECRRKRKREQAREYRERNREKIRKSDRIRYLFRTAEDQKKANERVAKYRKTENGKQKTKEYIKRNKDKFKARWTTMNAVRDGKLTRADKCTLCLSTDSIEAHHPDYTKPFDVIWVCKACHMKIHKKG